MVEDFDLSEKMTLTREGIRWKKEKDVREAVQNALVDFYYFLADEIQDIKEIMKKHFGELADG